MVERKKRAECAEENINKAKLSLKYQTEQLENSITSKLVQEFNKIS